MYIFWILETKIAPYTFSAYGSAVGSCAMSFLPTGGLYVTGGLLRNLLKQENTTRSHDKARVGTEPTSEGDIGIEEEQSLLSLFLESYCSKGSASFLLDDIPLCVVLAKDTGLRGAAIRAEMVRFE